MSQRYRVTFIAIGLTALNSGASFSQSPEKPIDFKAGSSKESADDKSYADKVVFPVRILENPPKTEADKRGEQEAEHREKADLVAQESMAESTKQIVVISWAQFVLAFLGTAALVYSIALNRKATLAAIQGAKASFDAVQAAREAIGIERAWILHASQGVNRIYNTSSGQIEHLGFCVVWKNVGRSPALNVEPWMNFTICDQPDIIPEISLDHLTHDKFSSNTVVGPGIEFASDEPTLRRDIVEALIKRKKFLFIRTAVEYEDVFHPKITRRTDCFFLASFIDKAVDGQRGPFMTLSPCGTLNGAT